jgi:hypothetical protein
MVTVTAVLPFIGFYAAACAAIAAIYIVRQRQQGGSHR